MLATIHYRETSLRRYNPPNRQGVYQLYSYTGGGNNSNAFTDIGEVSDAEFQRQTDILAELLQNSYGTGLNLKTDDGIKTLLFRYNGTAKSYIAQGSALGNLELALSLSEKVDENIIKSAAGRAIPDYDKKGDKHYDNISAFIKSMRGSDVDASLYYLARMLEAGEDPKFIARRMVIFASEDIGLAGNGGLTLAVSAFQAVERIGMPESQIILSHVVCALAKSKKDRSSYDALLRAKEAAKNSMHLPVPIEIRNAPTKLMSDLGFGKGYKWEAGFHQPISYLPKELDDQKFFFPQKEN